MKQKLIHIFSTIALLAGLGLASCEDPYLGQTFVVYDVVPISAYLDSRPEVFSQWVDLLRQMDLYNAVNQSSSVFTLIAPTNEAVARFYADKRVENAEELIDEMGRDYVRQLLLYHLMPDSIELDDFVKGGQLPVATYTGDFLDVRFRQSESSDGGYNAIYLNGETHVSEFAISAANGLIYVVDDVMRPMIEPLPKVLYENGLNDIFSEALDKTAWADSLNVLADTIVSGSKEYIVTRFHTLLAVPDKVFQANGIQSFRQLAEYLGADTDYTNAGNALNRFVAGHILEGYRDLDLLCKFDVPREDSTQLRYERLWSTCCDDAPVKVTQEGGVFRLNAETGSGSAWFDEDASDYKVKNGLIHQLDNLLPPCNTLSPVRVCFDLTDFGCVRSFIDNYATSGQYYQKDTKALQTALPAGLSSFQYTVGPQGTPVSKPVAYCTVGAKSGSHAVLNRDYLSVGIGYLGHISFRTPSLPAGRYKVTLTYVYDTSLAGFKTYQNGSDGGLTTVSFEDIPQVESAKWLFYSSIPEGSTDFLFDMPVCDDLELTEPASHTVRITLDDPAASISSKYTVMLDCITFEPIDL